ncbi:hypothetical protein [Nocardia sp. NPDC050406]|uniref:hypothetical protein n=1 Tax=Nocardia sp. NPDC050406 TaxID=3364318 RepID=UPI0037916FDE
MEKRAIGRPDMFVWIPVIALLEAAGVCLVILQSTAVALVLIVVAVLLVGLDAWINR